MLIKCYVWELDLPLYEKIAHREEADGMGGGRGDGV